MPCRSCYYGRMGEWHRITNADLESAIGDCSVCGTGVPLRILVRGEHLTRACFKGRPRTYGKPMRADHESLQRMRAAADAQDGLCAICDRERPLQRDHDHETGDFRGWLCMPCNRSIGNLGDSLEGVLRAAAYLARSETRAVSRRSSQALRERLGEASRARP